ncbi:MAG TPA: zinc-ribbon domain-containing protein [Gemmataceae bacterium]|nr:zinc-ribbon domain-containing protein [Gemmataceae bacterium]
MVFQPLNYVLAKDNLPVPARKSAANYDGLADERGLTWLGPFPRNTKALTAWRCGRGHEFQACYNNVYQGMNCKFCVREDNGQNQRHGPADYHALAEKRGIFWLGPAVNSALDHTVWECADGHRWSARYNAIQQGTGCARCGHERRAARVRRQPAEYHHLATVRGFKWLGPTVGSSKTMTEWECATGHRWWSTYNRIDQGSGCRRCSGLSPLTPADFLALAARRGFVWFGTGSVNSRTRTDWRCSQGHEWRTTYTSIMGGSGCPDCSGNLRKTIEEFSRVAEERGFLWHGPLVPNSKTKTEWECPKGHRWFAPFNAVQQGNGCWECSGLMPKTPDDYRLLATERGFVWDELVVANTSEKSRWRCPAGHLFLSSYNTIKAEHGCPYCLDMVNGARVSKNQRILCEMLGGELNGAKVGRFTIDVTKQIGDLKIAVEYDTWFYHSVNLERDRRKNQALLNDGWSIVRVRTENLLPTATQLDEAIAALVQGEKYVDIELADWGVGPRAPWTQDESDDPLFGGVAVAP